MSKSEQVRKLVVMSLLVAVSVVLIYAIHFPLIPAAPFLEYDPADIPILIGALAYGPVAGVLLTVVASIIQGVTVSAGSGLYGIVMHIIATSTLVVVASGIYHIKRNVFTISSGWVEDDFTLRVPESDITENADSVTVGIGYVSEAQTFAKSSGNAGSCDFYRCASVNGNYWSGYKGSFIDGSWIFSTELTAGLAINAIIPEPGFIYNADASVKILSINIDPRLNDAYCYYDLSSSNNVLDNETVPHDFV